MVQYGDRQQPEQLPQGRYVSGDPGAFEKRGYVRLSAGAGNGAQKRGKPDYPGGFPVSGAVQATGSGADLRQACAGGQTDDPGVLPSGTGR